MAKKVYRGKPRHPSDVGFMFDRARKAGLIKLIVTAGNLKESKEALGMVSADSCSGLFCTVGVHPTRARELDEGGDEYLAALLSLARKGAAASKVVAIGECGLDYDRLNFCSKEVQLKNFNSSTWTGKSEKSVCRICLSPAL